MMRARLSIVAVAMCGLMVAAEAFAGTRVYIRIGDRSAYKPKVISLGSTGYVNRLRWSNWNGALAVGRGRGHATSTSIPPDAPHQATIRLSGRRTCQGEFRYTRVSYRVLGLKYRERLGCARGLHP
jgi:hypothetical protein